MIATRRRFLMFAAPAIVAAPSLMRVSAAVLDALPVLDADVRLWASAVASKGGAVSDPRLATVSAYVTALKRAGIWQHIDNYWPLSGDNVTQATTSIKGGRSATPSP